MLEKTTENAAKPKKPYLRKKAKQTEKDYRFSLEYIRNGGNASAALRTLPGYENTSQNVIGSIASDMLKKANVQKSIQLFHAKLEKALEYDVNQWVKDALNLLNWAEIEQDRANYAKALKMLGQYTGSFKIDNEQKRHLSQTLLLTEGEWLKEQERRRQITAQSIVLKAEDVIVK